MILLQTIYNKSYYVYKYVRAIINAKDISSFDEGIISYQIKRFFPHLSEELIYLARKIKFNDKSQTSLKIYRENLS